LLTGYPGEDVGPQRIDGTRNGCFACHVHRQELRGHNAGLTPGRFELRAGLAAIATVVHMQSSRVNPAAAAGHERDTPHFSHLLWTFPLARRRWSSFAWKRSIVENVSDCIDVIDRRHAIEMIGRAGRRALKILQYQLDAAPLVERFQ
jgi:hypothetical protein